MKIWHLIPLMIWLCAVFFVMVSGCTHPTAAPVTVSQTATSVDAGVDAKDATTDEQEEDEGELCLKYFCIDRGDKEECSVATCEEIEILLDVQELSGDTIKLRLPDAPGNGHPSNGRTQRF